MNQLIVGEIVELILRKITTHKKLFFTIVLFFLVYLFLYLVPGLYSLRFTVGLFFPVIFLCMSLKLKHILSSFLSVFLIVLVIIVLVFTPLIPLSYTVLVGDREIHETVDGLVSEISDPELKVREIMNWEINNMVGMYGDEPDFGGFYFISEFPFTWIRDQNNPSWIFFYTRGMCQEFAVLFVKMAEFAEIVSRLVYNPAEDHEWVEVLIDDNWIHVDPSNNYYNQQGVYENGWGKQLSYVYTIDSEGEIIDITSRYTGTGRLIVRVVTDNEPVAGAEITVKSRFLMEKYPHMYNSARAIVPRKRQNFLTDENGEHVFNLGCNNYTIIAEFEGYEVEKNIALEENENNLVIMSLGNM